MFVVVFGVPPEFGFVLELEYFKGDCNAAARTGCLPSMPPSRPESKLDSAVDTGV